MVVLCFDCPYKLNAASQVLNPKSRSFKNAPPSPASGATYLQFCLFQRQEVGMETDYKGMLRELLQDDETVLNLDCGGNYTM